MAGETNRSTYIALLRGINVGGNNKLPMRDLTTIFQQAACTEVRTYIQSGNVLFQAETCLQPGLRLRLQQRRESHIQVRSSNLRCSRQCQHEPNQRLFQSHSITVERPMKIPHSILGHRPKDA